MHEAGMGGENAASRALAHRAAWVLPVTAPALASSVVTVHEGCIVGVGRAAVAGQAVDHGHGVLLPALVNAHAHLELSQLAELGQARPKGGFTDWIRALLALRERHAEDDPRPAAQAALSAMHDQGIGLVADIGNGPDGLGLEAPAGAELLSHLEIIGLGDAAAEAGKARLASLPEERRCCPHAPYSTHAELLKAIKARCRRLGHAMPIHLAESPAEVEFLRSGGGEFRTFLQERGVLDPSFFLGGIDKGGAVRYLEQLGLLDAATLCVHCVQIEAGEIEILARRRARVCLCPGSNQRLEVGAAPVEAMLACGLRPALGTDSLASNPRLSLWREMRLLRELYPAVAPAAILAMATINGAVALGREREMGSLEIGKRAALLWVKLPAEVRAEDQVLDFLTSADNEVQPEWLAPQVSAVSTT